MADRLHVKPRHRAAVGRLLREHLPGVEAWAYGSRASGRSHDGSDLDLALRGPGLREIPAVRLAAFDDALRESNVPFLVEARDWARIPERFRREIERNHVVFAEGAMSPATSERVKMRLGDCIVVNPSNYSTKDGWNFINYLDTSSITDNRIDGVQRLVPGVDKIPASARRKVRAGDIVYSTVRPNQRHFGLLKDVPENSLASTAFAVIRGRTSVACTGFVYRFLTQDHVINYLHRIAEDSSSVYPSMRPSDIENLEIELPPLCEQRAIARVLGALDDRIELNRRMNETLEATARAIFKDWFVDFGPVRAKMDGRQPYLPPEIWELFPMTLDDTGMPSGWKRDRLGAIATAHAYGAAPSNVPTDTPYIGLKHIPRRSVAIESWDNAHNVSTAKFKFRKGDFLFGRLRPYFHKVGIAPVDGICSTDIVVVVPKRPEWRSVTLFVISSRNFVDYADRTSTGTKMPRTGWNTMCQFPICLPAENLAGAFDDHVNGLLRRVQSNVRTTQALAQIRNALLPRLVSGEVRMPKETPNLQQIEV